MAKGNNAYRKDKKKPKKGKGVKAMLDYVKTLEGWEKVILPIGNGLLMVRKK